MKHLIITAAWAAFGVVAIESVGVLVTIPTEFAQPSALLAVLGALLAVLGLPLLLAGVGLGGAARLGAFISHWGRERQPVRPARRVAWVLVGGLLAGGLALSLQPLTAAFWRMFRQKTYAGLAVGLYAVAFVGLAAVLAPAMVRAVAAAVDALGRRLPAVLDPRRGLGALIWSAAGLVIMAGPVVGAVSALRSVDLGPARLVCTWLLLLCAFALVRYGRALTWGAWGVIAAMLLGLMPAWLGLTGATARQALMRDTVLASWTAPPMARLLADGDSDGAPRALGGLDCDDAQPGVRPGAYDTPGDGIDQNCTGADYDGRDPWPRPRRVPPQGEAPDLDVILITVDALRFDMITDYMPALKALEAESVVFENAYAHGAATYWSMPAMLASTLPSRLDMACSKTPEKRMVMLPEVLEKHGYTTAMFTGTALFFRDGLRQGIKHPNFDASNRTGAGWKGPGGLHQTSDIFKYMEKGPGRKAKKSFIWTHYYDPHYPYFEIEGYPPEDSSDWAKYVAIVRYTDAQIARLIQRLKKNGRWDRTVLILTADHGEAFGEHGHAFHGQAVYDESVKVPLIIRVPGVAPRRITAPIGLMDVSPTLLDLLKLPVPRPWLGRSWLSAMNGEPPPDAPVFVEVLPDSNYKKHMVGMRRGDWKLIHHVTDGRDELYNLADDPGELRNLYDTAPEAQPMRAELMRYLDHAIAELAKNKAGTYLPPGAPKSKKRRCKP